MSKNYSCGLDSPRVESLKPSQCKALIVTIITPQKTSESDSRCTLQPKNKDGVLTGLLCTGPVTAARGSIYCSNGFADLNSISSLIMDPGSGQVDF